jgi:hypothetical protein
MSDEQKGLWGCVALIGVALLIGVGVRSKSLVQFLVMAAAALGGLIAVVWSLGSLSKEGLWNKLIALWWGFWAVWLAIAVGSFLRTGDYDSAAQRLGIGATSTPEAASTRKEAVQATVTPTIPRPTLTPVPTATLVTTTTSSAVETAWYSKLLADRSIAQPASKQLESWRLYLGIVLGIQYLMALYVAQRTKKRNIGYNLVLGIIGMLLVFTKLGEWVYKIILWVFGWGLWGKVVAVILAVLTGVGGVGNITAYIIAGYVYHDLQVMGLCVLPSVIVAFPALFIALHQARNTRYIKPD